MTFDNPLSTMLEESEANEDAAIAVSVNLTAQDQQSTELSTHGTVRKTMNANPLVTPQSLAIS